MLWIIVKSFGKVESFLLQLRIIQTTRWIQPILLYDRSSRTWLFFFLFGRVSHLFLFCCFQSVAGVMGRTTTRGGFQEISMFSYLMEIPHGSLFLLAFLLVDLYLSFLSSKKISVAGKLNCPSSICALSTKKTTTITNNEWLLQQDAVYIHLIILLPQTIQIRHVNCFSRLDVYSICFP